MRSFKCGVWQNLHGFLVGKSTGVTSGWMLNAAITASVALMVSRGGIKESLAPSADSDPAGGALGNVSVLQAISAFLLTLIIFSLILVATATCSRFVHGAEWIPERLRGTYSSGLSFIPAWQWKNVVSALMVACLGGAASERSPYLVAAVVLIICGLTAAIQMLLENWASAEEETSLAFQIFNGLRTSLGLGIGFAVNVLVHAVGGSSMKVPWVMTVYVISLTLAVATLKYKCTPMVASMKDIWSPLLCRSLTFSLLASNFVVGWAWKGMIDMIIAATMHEGILWHLFAALLITLCLSCCVVAITAAATSPAFAGTPGLEDLCMLACAMNVGWAWAGFAMAFLRFYGDGKALGIGQMWLFTLAAVTSVSLAAMVIDMGLRQVRPLDPEEEKLVK